MRFEGDEISAAWDDSRRVTPGSLFAALDGPVKRGEDFIPEAVSRGAAIVVLSIASEPAARARFPNVKFVGVDDPRSVFRKVVADLYGRVSDKVRS